MLCVFCPGRGQTICLQHFNRTLIEFEVHFGTIYKLYLTASTFINFRERFVSMWMMVTLRHHLDYSQPSAAAISALLREICHLN